MFTILFFPCLCRNNMKGLYLVEPAVGLYAFSCFLIFPLIQQFVYRRLWEDITNTTYSEFDNISRCGNDSGINDTNYQEVTSLLSLYTELFTAIPSSIVTILLVAYSDRGGRKIAITMPVIGTLLYITGLLAISYFKLNIYLTIGCSLVSSFFGGFGTFLGGCFAYVADISENDRQKTLRLAGVDMILGVLGGAAALLTGYFLKAAGFNWPFITAALGLIILLLYVFFVLEETVKKVPPGASTLDSPPQGLAIKQMFSGIYQVFAGGDSRYKTTLIILFVAFTIFVFADMGSLSLITLYELNKPLCWTGIMIGYGSALGTMVPQTLIVLMGILSFMLGMAMISFARTTQLMFLGYFIFCFSGALFACISCMESLTSTVSIAAFNSIYAATVAWCSGFVFLLSPEVYEGLFQDENDNKEGTD
uniref:Solute carrier family 46 member 3 n=1 Tax=Neogobius melanostomus TaxID=47308 RepID=A0A8C6SQ68_9GOBI